MACRHYWEPGVFGIVAIRKLFVWLIQWIAALPLSWEQKAAR